MKCGQRSPSSSLDALCSHAQGFSRVPCSNLGSYPGPWSMRKSRIFKICLRLINRYRIILNNWDVDRYKMLFDYCMKRLDEMSSLKKSHIFWCIQKWNWVAWTLRIMLSAFTWTLKIHLYFRFYIHLHTTITDNPSTRLGFIITRPCST